MGIGGKINRPRTELRKKLFKRRREVARGRQQKRRSVSSVKAPVWGKRRRKELKRLRGAAKRALEEAVADGKRPEKEKETGARPETVPGNSGDVEMVEEAPGAVTTGTPVPPVHQTGATSPALGSPVPDPGPQRVPSPLLVCTPGAPVCHQSPQPLAVVGTLSTAPPQCPQSICDVPSSHQCSQSLDPSSHQCPQSVTSNSSSSPVAPTP